MADDRDRRAVRTTYDAIAEHFARTRAHPWPEAEAFCEDRSGDVAVDVGCGNGRNAELLAGVADRVVGVDASGGLLATAADRVPAAALLQGDAARLPLAADVADLGVYVATLHHLPERRLRRRSLGELARVLAPGGEALVSAWSTTHDRFDADDAEIGFDTHVDWTLPDGETVPRYYHIYAPAEFETDLAAGDLSVARSWRSSGNCYAVVTAAERKGP
ncbi:SAM-dependent methyltransferase [Halobacteriales archaeon QS_9_70_65]|nr:MAG: SAM-dependent methyltransferase [Halobacteriales archaeon QS_9_70_65]